MAVEPAVVAEPQTHGISSVATHLTLAGLSAVLLALAFPEPGWWPLAHVALVPVTVLALASAGARRLAWTTYLVALAWWLVRISWLTGVTVGGYIGLSAYMVLYTPAAMLLVRWLHRRYRAASVLALPMAWVSLEFVRCHFLQGGFAWFALGHSQAPDGPKQGGRLIQVADLFGQHAVSFLVAMTNGLIVDLLSRPLLRRRAPGAPSGRRIGRTAGAATALWALAIGSALLYGQYRLRETPAAAGDDAGVLVAVVQTNVPQDNKEHASYEQTIADWTRMIELTRDAAAADRRGVRPALVVWPETMVPVALNPEAQAHYHAAGGGQRTLPEEIADQVTQVAQRLGVNLLAGAAASFDYRVVHAKDGGSFEAPERQYNSAFLYTADGRQDPRRYDKVHRVPFGEYIPWVDSSPALKALFIKYLSPYDFDYTVRAGEAFTVFDVPLSAPGAATGPATPGTPGSPGTPGTPATVTSAPAPVLRVAAPICFEDAYPDVARQMVYGDGGEKRADLLVNLTNDGWYPGTDQGPQQLQIAVLRTVENRVPMARSVNTGISGFIDSAGRVGPLVEVDGRRQRVEGWALHRVTLDPRQTLFGRLGHGPMLTLLALTAAFALGGLRRSRPLSP